ncbi:MAG TPA: hemerythrin domain-containing protein [Gammaproteobacteria bacterium]|jgi:hypothetical protein
MLRTLFGYQPKEDRAPKTEKNRHGVPFDPGLITALTHQHRELVMLLVRASSAAELGYYAEAQTALSDFKNTLEAHLRRESIQLMPYLAAHLRGEDAAELMREMQTNTTLIQRTVKGFLDRYLGKPITAANLQRFQRDIDAMSDEFCQEVEREEAAFYTLYMTPDAY